MARNISFINQKGGTGKTTICINLAAALVHNNKRVLVVEDVTTSGNSVVKTINIIRQNHGIVDEVLVVVDRESGAEKKLLDLDISFIPILSVSEILKK